MTPKPNHPKSHRLASRSQPAAVRKAAAHPSRAHGVIAESFLNSKGQVRVPQAIQALYQLGTGDSLVWRREDDGRLVVEPRRSPGLVDNRAAGPSRAFTDAEMDAAIGQALEAMLGRD